MKSKRCQCGLSHFRNIEKMDRRHVVPPFEALRAEGEQLFAGGADVIDKASSIARSRHVEPASLPRKLRGDLDWIIMKCLEKERSRRYDTASALSADLGRYLAMEPVEAGPPSKRYRAGKFFRRNRKQSLQE